MPKGKEAKLVRMMAKGGSVARAKAQGRRDKYKKIKNEELSSDAQQQRRDDTHNRAKKIVCLDVLNSNASEEMKALLMIVIANTQPK